MDPDRAASGRAARITRRRCCPTAGCWSRVASAPPAGCAAPRCSTPRAVGGLERPHDDRPRARQRDPARQRPRAGRRRRQPERDAVGRALRSCLEPVERDGQHDRLWRHGRAPPDGRVLIASGGTGDVYSLATGTWTPDRPDGLPVRLRRRRPAANGQVLYVGGSKVKYCGQYSCDEPIADAELYSP